MTSEREVRRKQYAQDLVAYGIGMARDVVKYGPRTAKVDVRGETYRVKARLGDRFEHEGRVYDAPPHLGDSAH